MFDKPSSCHGCPLEFKGYSFSRPEGLGTNNVVFVGESLGDAEAREGLPFRPKGQAGSKLEQCIRMASAQLLEPLHRRMFKVWNLIACQPPYNLLDHMPWEQGAIAHCREAHFNAIVDDVEDISKRVIVALGNLPLRHLTNASGIAKEKQSITHLRGYVFKSPQYGLVVPSLHPAFIQRGKPNLTSLLTADIILALKTARGEFAHRWHKDFIKPSYVEYPSLDDCWSFYHQTKDNTNKILTYDIETGSDVEEDEKDLLDSNEIRQVQFSLAKHTGVAVPWQEPFLEVIAKIFETRNTKANHNTWNFDNPKITAKGMAINGRLHDTMWMFKHYQPNLPKGLQAVASLAGFPFPWKHLFGPRFQWYGCADVDAVQWILAWLPPVMKAMGVWQGYYDHTFRLYSPTLLRASTLGIPVNETERLKLYDPINETGVFKDKLDSLDNELQGLIPDSIKNIKPKSKDKKTGEVRYGYIRTPKEVTQFEVDYNFTVEARKDTDNPVKSTFEQAIRKSLGYELRQWNEEYRWCKVQPFKPSLDQVARYIKWKKEQLTSSSNLENQELAELYVVPTVPRVNKSTGEREEKESTGVKVLTELFEATGDRVLEAALELRSVGTIINNFLPNWQPASDGAVHTTWGFSAASGQLDSRKPNILNASKHTDNGQYFRRTIEAPKGYVFVEFDKRSYHVATMGFEANSKQYIRFSQLDPHSIFASWIMPSSWGKPIDMEDSDEVILEQCVYIKKRSGTPGEIPVRQIAKPCVLGNQLGLGHIKLWAQNKKLINSPKYARELQIRLAERFPEVEAAKKRIRETAHRQSYLINDWHYIQWFFEVFKPYYSKAKGMWVRANGGDAEKALAFAVQGDAFGEIKWNLLEAERLGYNENWNFINSIHDSVIYMPRVSDLQQCIAAIYSLFSRPCSVLVNESTGPAGLQVGVEVSIGKNWQKQDYFGKGTNPEGMREVKDKELKEVYGVA